MFILKIAFDAPALLGFREYGLPPAALLRFFDAALGMSTNFLLARGLQMMMPNA